MQNLEIGDAAAEELQRLLDAAADADVHEAVRQGIEDVRLGRTRPANAVFDEILGLNEAQG